MCGLIGMVGEHLNPALRTVMYQGLMVDMLRGVDGTGIGAMKGDKSVVMKSSMAAGQFLLESFGDDKQFVADSAGYDVLMGHNRWATVGDVDDDGAHPFEHGSVTLAHNGTLRGAGTLENFKNFSVDSEAIAYNMSIRKPDEVIAGISGAFALSWFDKEKGEVFLCRNKERPLYLATVFTGKLVNYVWGSEKGMLDWILTRNHIKDYTIEELAVGELHKFNLKFSAGGPAVTVLHSTSTVELMKDVWVGNSKKYLYASNPFEVTGWVKVKKSLNKFGGYYVGEYSAQSSINILIKGVKRGVLSIGDICEGAVEYTFEAQTQECLDIITRVKVLTKAGASVVTNAKVIEKVASNIIHLPSPATKRNTVWWSGTGEEVSEAEFNELTKHGCCMCSGNIFIEDQYTLGCHDDDSPICPDCLNQLDTYNQGNLL